MSLFETLSAFALQNLPRDRFLSLRKHYYGVRQKFHPLMQHLYGTFGADDLHSHLKKQVGHDYEILMVHSSFNHMQPMYTGSALELLEMLIDFCGPDRTLVMPAFYFGDPQVNDVVAHYRQHPVFDLRRTPSQMGIVTELFRRSEGVLQSLHPTHRVSARGPLARQLTQGHELAGSALGKGTPFEFMAQHDARVIGIGKPCEVLSQVHHVEDLLGDAFPVPAQVSTVPIVLRDASKQEQAFELRWRKFDWPRKMRKLPRIMEPNTLEEWSFHHVPLFAARARDVTRALLEAARAGVTVYEEEK